MASALMILFLGCWLAGQSGVLGEGTDPSWTQEMDPTLTEPEGEGGTGPTQPGQTSVTTRAGSARPGGPEPSPAPDLTHPIIAGVSAAAAGLLLVLLLVAFVCYRRKGPAPRQSSTSPLAVLKTPAQEAPVYSNIDDGKETQTREPDSGAYAELDRQTLQPNVYDTINMSQGAPH